MNELIKTLAIQAGARECGGYITDPATGTKKWSSTGDLETAVLDVEKFAELLITSASVVYVKGSKEFQPWVNIKKAFGLNV